MIVFVTAEEVASYLRLATSTDPEAKRGAAAVNAYLAGRDDLLEAPGTPTAAAKLGALMLAAKLVRRRNSPYGTESVDGSVASYTARYDPDISRLLGIDYHAAPGVG